MSSAHCIYGVDKNPLAVELCKVALWLEAHNPGQPLNFLDHHIKCGNAIVGFREPRRSEQGRARRGVQATLPGDDKDTARCCPQTEQGRNAKANTGHAFVLGEVAQHLADILARMESLSPLPRKTPAEIEAKKKEFNAFTTGKDALAAEPDRGHPNRPVLHPQDRRERGQDHVTDEQFRRYWSGSQTPQGQGTAAAWPSPSASGSSTGSWSFRR
jgi:hypothetical protein